MHTQSKYWYLQKFNMMRKLSKSERMRLADTLEMKEFTKNSKLKFVNKGNHQIYFIKEGTVKICHYTGQGEEDIKCILGPGHIFGETALFDNIVEGETAIALEDVVVCLIGVSEMQEILDKNPSLKTSVYKLMGIRVRKLERRLSSILYKDSRTRILEFLNEMAQDYGTEEDGRMILKNFLTHSDIAKMTATTRQTVTSILNDLRSEGILEYDKEKYVFLKNVKKPENESDIKTNPASFSKMEPN